MKRTYFYNEKGEILKSHRGEPRKIDSFLKNAHYAARIEICEFTAYDIKSEWFTKEEDRWVGDLFNSSKGYRREVLSFKKKYIHREYENIGNDEAQKMLAEQSEKALPDARDAIRWCNVKDNEDSEGRYWLSAYAGVREYRLIVKNGRILASIPGGFRGSCIIGCALEAWVNALKTAIEEKISGEYNLLKADGSGTYFYLQDIEDVKYLKTKEYVVPSVNGGFHLNIEVG